MKTDTVRRINGGVSLAISCFALIFGILFFAFGLKLSQQKIPENYVETPATIARIEETLLPGCTGANIEDYEYRVFVAYSYGGQTFAEAEYSRYDSSMKEGDTVLLYLNPDDPAEFMADPSGSLVYAAIGAAILLGSVGGIGYNIAQIRKGKR